jgi:hypothetical protein
MNYLDLLISFGIIIKEPLGATTIAKNFSFEMWYINEENDFKVSDIAI